MAFAGRPRDVFKSFLNVSGQFDHALFLAETPMRQFLTGTQPVLVSVWAPEGPSSSLCTSLLVV